MDEEAMRQALLHLTTLRKRVLAANDTTGRLFASLKQSRSELEQAEKDLEQKLQGFHVWFEPRHARYVLVPKLDQENDKK